MFDYRNNRKKNPTDRVRLSSIVFLGSGSIVFLGEVRLGLYKEAYEKRGLKIGISALLSRRY